jgi:hypothetical protein
MFLLFVQEHITPDYYKHAFDQLKVHLNNGTWVRANVQQANQLKRMSSDKNYDDVLASMPKAIWLGEGPHGLGEAGGTALIVASLDPETARTESALGDRTVEDGTTFLCTTWNGFAEEDDDDDASHQSYDNLDGEEEVDGDTFGKAQSLYSSADALGRHHQFEITAVRGNKVMTINMATADPSKTSRFWKFVETAILEYVSDTAAPGLKLTAIEFAEGKPSDPFLKRLLALQDIIVGFEKYDESTLDDHMQLALLCGMATIKLTCCNMKDNGYTLLADNTDVPPDLELRLVITAKLPCSNPINCDEIAKLGPRILKEGDPVLKQELEQEKLRLENEQASKSMQNQVQLLNNIKTAIGSGRLKSLKLSTIPIDRIEVLRDLWTIYEMMCNKDGCEITVEDLEFKGRDIKITVSASICFVIAVAVVAHCLTFLAIETTVFRGTCPFTCPCAKKCLCRTAENCSCSSGKIQQSNMHWHSSTLSSAHPHSSSSSSLLFLLDLFTRAGR